MQKNKTEIDFYYIQGTGNPYTKLEAEEQFVNDEPSGFYKAKYTFYIPDGSNGLPVSGVYHKFTTKVAGELKVDVWANKTNRNTFVIDESTMVHISYQAEGYMDGQKDSNGKLKYLAKDEIQKLHSDKFINKTTGTDSNPYVIGTGAIFWGYIIIQAEAGKTYWFFQDSSQLGLQGFEFYNGSTQEPDTPEESVNQATQDYFMTIETQESSEHIYIRNIKEITFEQASDLTSATDYYLLLSGKDVSVAEIKLCDMPVITFTDTEICIKSETINLTKDQGDVDRIKFGNTASGITGITEETTKLDNEGADIYGLKTGDMANIYTADGKLIHSATATGNNIHISFSSLRKNTMYILRTPARSYKIIIK